MKHMVKGISENFDIIVAGAGIAGYSLSYEAFKHGLWSGKRVLIIDQQFGGRPPKMISFWDNIDSHYKEFALKSWQNLSFYAHNKEKIKLDTGNYCYYTIDSRQLLRKYEDFIRSCPEVMFVEAKVLSSSSHNGYCRLETDQGIFCGTYLFNSLFAPPQVPTKYNYFLQHFKGIKIQLDEPLECVDEALLMDYRTTQKYGTAFFYCLPLSSHTLFVEYTLFSKTLLPDGVYDQEITTYLSEILKISTYKVREEEFGIIPMTDYPFLRRDGNMMYLGTAGGDTRGSTGYTFMNVQQTVRKIMDAFSTTGTPFYDKEHIGRKDKLYDATLLSVLNEGTYQGHQIFADLFKGAPAKSVFRFLDARSSLWNDMKIMISLRTWPFLKHFIRILFRG